MQKPSFFAGLIALAAVAAAAIGRVLSKIREMAASLIANLLPFLP